MSFKIAVVGASGNVGRTMLRILAERKFPCTDVVALASRNSKGRQVSFGDKDLFIQSLEEYDFQGTDIALFSIESNIAKIYGEKAAKQNCIVIDNSSAFRDISDIPLIVPEVNSDKIEDYLNHNIIANPNCAVIQLVTALKAIHDYANIKKIVMSSYQSVSGAGVKAMDELYHQTKMRFGGNGSQSKIMPREIAFNIIPQIGEFLANGSCEEENKIIKETRRILNSDIYLDVTCTRVPVFVGHSEAVYIECENDILADKAIKLLSDAPTVQVMQNNNDYVTPIDCPTMPVVYVSRIRQSLFSSKSLNMWIVSDNLWKGAALNAVQIAEILVADYL